jgi:recombination protein RecR
MNLNYPSKILEAAVNEFSTLPGIGHKTALRLVLHLLKQDPSALQVFGDAISRLGTDLHFCRVCHNICDEEVCSVCADKKRDPALICIVESIKDVMILENTQQYRGVYHVLGGIISPMDGIGPADLNIETLEERLRRGGIRELIFALSATMEGDTTNFYLYRRLSSYKPVFSTLARGVSIGDELEYTDEITLGRSLINRIPFTATS